MKTFKIIKSLLLLLFLLVIAYISCYDGKEGETRNFKAQLGTYILDIAKTALGNYSKDSDIYKNLHITFKKDSTFSMNMKVPFIYDSIGTWKPAGEGVETWNYLFYKSNKNICTQFTQPWTDDSIFYMNSTTPQKDAAFIREIYFKKIKD